MTFWKIDEILPPFLEARQTYFEKYKNKAPQMSDDITKIVINIPHASHNEIWNTLWDKPVRANARVKKAEKEVNAARPFLDDNWKDIGENPNEYLVTATPYHSVSKKTGKKTTQYSFHAKGGKISNIHFASKISNKRLFQIQNAGINFYKRYQTNPKHIFPELIYDDLEKFIKDGGLARAIPKLKESFGKYFGVITVCHFLTDIGMAVKPDMHLMNTLVNIGAWQEGRCFDKTSNRYNPNKIEDLVEINSICADLAKGTYNEVTAHTLRKIDIELMGMSLNKDTWQF